MLLCVSYQKHFYATNSNLSSALQLTPSYLYFSATSGHLSFPPQVLRRKSPRGDGEDRQWFCSLMKFVFVAVSFLVLAPSSRPDENLTPSNWQTFFTLTLLINFAPFLDETNRTPDNCVSLSWFGITLFHYLFVKKRLYDGLGWLGLDTR